MRLTKHGIFGMKDSIRMHHAKLFQGLPLAAKTDAEKRLARLRNQHDLDRKFKAATADIWG